MHYLELSKWQLRVCSHVAHYLSTLIHQRLGFILENINWSLNLFSVNISLNWLSPSPYSKIGEFSDLNCHMSVLYLKGRCYLTYFCLANWNSKLDINEINEPRSEVNTGISYHYWLVHILKVQYNSFNYEVWQERKV